MKMTKTQFKLLMKECLTELINEGAFDRKLEQIAEAKMHTGNLPQSSNPLNEQIKGAPPGINPRILEAVNMVASGQTGARKNMYAELLLDTAMTTLQKQGASEMGGGHGGLMETIYTSPSEKIADDNQLNALANGNPGRWAAAAFGGKKKP